MALIHGKITKSIIGAAFEVYRVLGYGFLESTKRPCKWKATGVEVGLLINFGAQGVELKRLVLSNQSVFNPR